MRFLCRVLMVLALPLLAGYGTLGCDDGKTEKKVTLTKKAGKKPLDDKKKKKKAKMERLVKEEAVRREQEAIRASQEAMKAQLEKKALDAYEKLRQQKMILYKALQDCTTDVEKKLTELQTMEARANELIEKAKEDMKPVGEMFFEHVEIPKLEEQIPMDQIPELPPIESILPKLEPGQNPSKVLQAAPSVNLEELLKACEEQQRKLTVTYYLAKGTLMEKEKKLNDLVKDHKRMVTNSNRLYTAIAMQRLDYVSKCMAKMKKIDKKWTNGKGWAKVVDVVQSQAVQVAMASGYSECSQGYYKSGKSNYDKARKYGAPWFVTSFLKSKCKPGMKFELKKCY